MWIVKSEIFSKSWEYNPVQFKISQFGNFTMILNDTVDIF